MTTPLDTTGFAFADTGDALLITTQERSDTLARPGSLSFSAADSFSGCPAKWVGSQTYRDAEAPDPMRANNLGTTLHAGMEGVDNLIAAERTPEVAKKIARAWIDTMRNEVVPDHYDLPGAAMDWLASEVSEFNLNKNKVYKHLTDEQLPAFWEHVDSSIHMAFTLEDHRTLDIVGTEYTFKKIPLGGGGNARISGEIDRITREPDGGLTIGDYKDGAYRKPYTANGGRDGKQDQLLLYAAAARQLPEVSSQGPVTRAQIIYTNAEKGARITPYDPNERDVADSINWFVDTYDKQVGAHAEREFALKPSPLCAWCPLAQVCPAAQIGNPKKAAEVDAADAADAAADAAGVPRPNPSRYLPEKRKTIYKARAAAAGQPSPVRLPIPTLPRSAKLAAGPRILQFTESPKSITVLSTPAVQETAMTTASTPPTARPELRPWDAETVTYNGYEVLQFASPAAIRTFGTVSFAGETLRKALAGTSQPIPTPEQDAALARTLYAAQMYAAATLAGGAVAQSSAIVTRVAGILHEVIERYPLPLGGDRAAWAGWMNTLVAETVRLGQLAESLFYGQGALPTDDDYAWLGALPAPGPFQSQGE